MGKRLKVFRSCDLEWANQLAVDVIDERIPEDEVWQQAEKKDREPDLSWPKVGKAKRIANPTRASSKEIFISMRCLHLNSDTMEPLP